MLSLLILEGIKIMNFDEYVAQNIKEEKKPEIIPEPKMDYSWLNENPKKEVKPIGVRPTNLDDYGWFKYMVEHPELAKPFS